ncbi:cation transport ATPase [Paragemmobacter straminiformis]|uniref:Cation transport ATPase n=1 Tax=Paragemmobacter straminiformis TaxID=2045119 RepID=A0A842I3N2_9RHOB|nr:cation transport ATPase [Gemmobacter straminiformis]MBC2834470.1 cation transport ATPase [Gemmobacter straminiformis]
MTNPWRAALAVLVALALAGCDAAGVGRIRSIDILDGAVTAAAPSGYCISPGAGMRGTDAAVILMGRCSGSPSATAAPAVITLSVGPAGSAGVMADGGASLAAFFQTEEGRGALSRAGKAEDVRVLSAVGSDDAFVMHVADSAVGEYWRAIRGLRGRLATISVSGAEGAPITSGQGKALLEATLAALAAANRVAAAVAP